MKLYHGTNARLLHRISKVGIQPRALSKAKGNWNHTVPSNPSSVYLTDAYPFHFAAMGGRESHGLILEVDRSLLLPWKLCPDEDALEQGSRKHLVKGGPPLEWSMEKRTRHYRKFAPLNPQLADISLKILGTVGYYNTISFSAVTRYAIIDWGKLDMTLYLMAADTSVAALNYMVLQNRHRALVRWFFGDPVTADELMTMPVPQDGDQEMIKILRSQRDHMAEVMKDRSAIEVIDRRKKEEAA